MEIPDNSVGWGIGLLCAIVAWLVRLEARLNARPTRREQEIIADKVSAHVDAQFNEIKRILEKQNERLEMQNDSTIQHRQWVGDSLAEIRTRVAVLRERSGDDPLAETGAHRRRL